MALSWIRVTKLCLHGPFKFRANYSSSCPRKEHRREYAKFSISAVIRQSELCPQCSLQRVARRQSRTDVPSSFFVPCIRSRHAIWKLLSAHPPQAAVYVCVSPTSSGPKHVREARRYHFVYRTVIDIRSQINRSNNRVFPVRPVGLNLYEVLARTYWPISRHFCPYYIRHCMQRDI